MGQKTIVSNKKAFHNFEVLDRFVAGVELLGTEVKSLRAGKANLIEAYVDIKNDEAILVNSHISPYSHATAFNHDETRNRRLLLTKKEIIKLKQAIEQKGLTIVPLKFFLKNSLIKIEIALAKGKKLYDKRESAKKKTAQREIQRSMKHN